MDTQAAANLAIELMEKHGLYRYPNPWTFEWDNARRRFGLCSFRRRVISLSRPLAQLTTEADVRDTILHEIAHALAGPTAGHGRVWKLMAMAVGARPERCASAEALGIELPRGKWTGTCPAGHTVTRHKRLRKGRVLSCSRCCPCFNRAFAFVWTHESHRHEFAEAAREVKS